MFGIDLFFALGTESILLNILLCPFKIFSDERIIFKGLLCPFIKPDKFIYSRMQSLSNNFKWLLRCSECYSSSFKNVATVVVLDIC